MYRRDSNYWQILPSLSLLLWILIGSIEVNGQMRRSESYWSIGLHTGLSGYRGDIATRSLESAKGFWGITASRHLFNHLSIGGHFTWARIYGSDNAYAALNTSNYLRNLHFRNDLGSIGVYGRWEFLNQLGHHANRQVLRPYVQVGLDVFYHNPKAITPTALGSLWVPLQPLQTEGQGYSRWQLGIPMTVGLSFKVSSKVDISPFVTYNFTTTDYLDDAAHQYVDAGDFGDNPIARALADRSMESIAAETGNSRASGDFSIQSYTGSDGQVYESAHGFPQQARRGGVAGNDSYWMVGVKVHWIISKKRRLEDLSRLHQITPKSPPEKSSLPFPKDEWVRARDRHIATPIDINTAYSEVVTSYYKDGILFDSDKPDKNNMKGRGKGSLYNIYYAPSIGLMSGKLVRPVIVGGEKLQDSNHIHPFQQANSDTVIFAVFGKQGKNNTVSHHRLYFSTPIAEAIWDKAQELPFNHSEYSYSHPALSADGKTLYMVSDRPDGIGGTDIYISHYHDGEWTIPKNLGETINTKGNELYPFIHPDGTLYFASDGHIGMGGLDVFEAYMKEDTFSIVKNLGVPINSKYNDFSLILDLVKRNGFFTSDRIGGDGSNDIYKLKVEKLSKSRKLTDMSNQVTEKTITIEGIVIDQFSGRPIPNAYISFKNMVNNVLDIYRTDDRGVFSFPASSDGIYKISSTAFRYQSMELQAIEDVGQKDSHGNIEVRLEMYPNNVKLKLKGRITAEGTSGPINDARISLIVEGEESDKKTILTDVGGEYFFRLHRNLSYTILIEKEGYATVEHKFDTSHQLFAETIVVNKQLKKSE